MKKTIYSLILVLISIVSVNAQSMSLDSAINNKVYLNITGNDTSGNMVFMQLMSSISGAPDTTMSQAVTDTISASTQIIFSIPMIVGGQQYLFNGEKYYWRALYFHLGNASNPFTGIVGLIPVSSADSITTLSLVPILNSITPSLATAGSGTTTITAVGTNFVPLSSLVFNGLPHAETYVSVGGDTLQATLLASDFTTTGIKPVAVSNPAPGGGLSDTLNFTVACPSFTVTAFSPATICSGGSATLTASGASSYVWSSGQSTSSIVVAPTSTSTYSVVGTDAYGCTNTGTDIVTVNPKPNVSVSGGSTICAGNSATLTASGVNTYVWASGQSTSSIVLQTNPISGSSTFTFLVTGTDLNGCANIATDSVIVNANPIATATVSPATICDGFSSTLSGGGGSNYLWNPGNLSGAPTVSPTTTTNYSVLVTDNNGCTATQTVTLNVNSLPVITAASSSPICIGASATLTGGGATTYNWNPGNLNGSPLTVSPTSNTTYTVVGTDLNGCVATQTVAVAVNALPNATANASSSSICLGSNVTLTGGGGTSYVWMPGNLLGASQVLSPAVPTNYSVTVTDVNGCLATQTVAIGVNALPVVTAASNATICFGNSATLTASGASSYVWSSGQSAVQIVVAPTVNTSYSVIGTDANGCANTDSVSVTVDPLIVINPGLSTTLIVGQLVNTSAAASGGTGIGTYLFSASGYPLGLTFSSSGSWGSAPMHIGTSTVSVTATDQLGCNNSATEVVTVSCLTGAITLDTINWSPAYAGQPFNGVIVASGGIAPYHDTIVFGNLPNGLQPLSDGSFVGNIAATGSSSFMVVGTDQAGCSSAAIPFTINAINPSPGLTSVSPAQLPVLSPALTLTLTGTGFAPASVAKLSGSSRATTFVSPTEVTMVLNAADVASVSSYAIRVDNPTPGGGPSLSKPFNVVQGPPPPTISVVIDDVSCGEYWQSGTNGGPRDSARVDFTYSSPDSIKLTFLYDFHAISAIPFSDPAGPLKLGPGTRTLSRTISGLKTDSVYGFVISYVTANMPGALLSNSDSCITPTMGVSEIPKDANQLAIYPNPFTGDVAYVTFDNTNGTLTIYDITSQRIVGTVEMKDGKAKIEKGNLVSGIYLLELVSKSGQKCHGKLVVVH